METLLIDRSTPLEKLFSFVGAERIRISKSGTGALFTTVADADDDAARAARRARIDAAFDSIQIDLTGFKFDRDEANDYE
jgi:hypothetical protein